MLDDLVELAVDIGGEIIGALVERCTGKTKQQSNKKKKNYSESKEPWEKPIEKPVWEE